MTYQEAQSYLDSFINYEKIPFYDYKKSIALNRMERFLGLLGNPEKGLKTIHIAGTKGKGSTAAMISSVLKEAGLKVGLYTSPHLVSFRERIRVNGNEIPENELCRILEEIKPHIESIKKSDPPSFFEIYTAIAFLYFKSQNVDFAVLETGMGGRLDATNAANAKISIITPISFEHIQKLGDTLREIASEKAGIIKDNTFCISAPQEKEALEVIENACRGKNARFCLVGKDIIFEEDYFNGDEQNFKVWGRFGEYHDLKLKLLGRHQIINAALGIAAVESLCEYGVIISEDSIKKGFLNVDWPGRLEIINKDPHIVLDGAQNQASAKALVEAIKRHFNFNKVILVLAMSKDKDIAGTVRVLSEFADEIIVTQAQNPRAAEPEKIAKFFKDKPISLARDSKEALNIAYSKTKKGDIIIITGSLFLIGEIKQTCQVLTV